MLPAFPTSRGRLLPAFLRSASIFLCCLLTLLPSIDTQFLGQDCHCSLLHGRNSPPAHEAHDGDDMLTAAGRTIFPRACRKAPGPPLVALTRAVLPTLQPVPPSYRHEGAGPIACDQDRRNGTGTPLLC